MKIKMLMAFVALLLDVYKRQPIGQGERLQLIDREGKPLTRGATTEHTLLNAVSYTHLFLSQKMSMPCLR